MKITAPMVIALLRLIEAKGSLETVKRLSQRLNESMTYDDCIGLKTDAYRLYADTSKFLFMYTATQSLVSAVRNSPSVDSVEMRSPRNVKTL